MRLNFSHIVLGALLALAVVGGVVMTVLPMAAAGDIRVVEVAPTAAPALSDAPTPAEMQVGVYLSGAVVRPGVYVVQGGSRLASVLLLAGGATAEADLTAVNLAVVVQDEEHWHFPERGAVLLPSTGLTETGRGTASARPVQVGQRADGMIDLNGADVEMLKSLPGIGDVRAQAIVSYREANGDFASVDGLLEVDGIGAGIVEGIRDLVTVE